MARCGRAPDCPPEGCLADDCCVTQDHDEAEDALTCPTCGSPVKVVGSDEGTMSYLPVGAANRAPVFAALAAERDGLRREVQRLRAREARKRENAERAEIERLKDEVACRQEKVQALCESSRALIDAVAPIAPRMPVEQARWEAIRDAWEDARDTVNALQGQARYLADAAQKEDDRG